MKIYVAAARQNIDLAREMMTRLREAGHTITHDWIADIDRNGPDDVKVSREEVLRCARNDVGGVYRADVFWLLSPDATGSGCFWENGYYSHLLISDLAEGRPERVMVISGDVTRSIFYLMMENDFGAKIIEAHEDALQFILGLRIPSGIERI